MTACCLRLHRLLAMPARTVTPSADDQQRRCRVVPVAMATTTQLQHALRLQAWVCVRVSLLLPARQLHL